MKNLEKTKLYSCYSTSEHWVCGRCVHTMSVCVCVHGVRTLTYIHLINNDSFHLGGNSKEGDQSE